MDSRERVFLSLDHEEPDRVPVDFWATKGAWTYIEAETGTTRDAFLDAHDIDFRYVDGPRHVGPPLAHDTDIWGVRRRAVEVVTPHGKDTYSEVDVAPLAEAASAEEIAEYPGWPDPDWFDYSVVADQCRRVRDAGRVAVFMGDRLNRVAQLKPAMYLRGTERILMDLAIEPEIARVVLGSVRSFYETYLERILEAAGGLVDIVLTGDDFGGQQGPLVSPAMWDDFLSEGFGRYVDLIHAGGARAMHHTCGDVRDFVGRMRALGLDVLQSLQPEAMADYFPRMKAEWGREMSFHGGLSVQRTLPRGTPEDVAAEVRERVRVLAPGGGYVLSTAHNIQADCPIENVLAMLDACFTAGEYPVA